MKNKYVLRARISEAKFRQIIKYFALDLQANQIAELTGLSRNSINNYLKAVREAIVHQADSIDEESDDLKKNAACPLFGLRKQQATIEIHSIPPQYHKMVRDHIKGKSIGDISHEAHYFYDGIIDYSQKKHYNLTNSGINDKMGDTSFFWGYIKMRLMRFRGVPYEALYLHLKESEFRYNNRDKDVYKMMLELFRHEPLKL